MKRLLWKIIISVLILCSVSFVVFAFTRDTVFVFDTATKRPVVGAKVTLVHPSFIGSTYRTGRNGIVRLWEGLPYYSVVVSKEGYAREEVITATFRTNHLQIGLMPQETE